MSAEAPRRNGALSARSTPADNGSDLSDSPYYGLSMSCREVRPGSWLARCTIGRRDTGEVVKARQHSGKTQAEALDAADASRGAMVASLDPTPHEWNRVQLRGLLRQYRDYNDGLTSILARLQGALTSGGLAASSMHSEFWKARVAAIDGSMALARKLAALPEDDRVDLMTSADAAYLDPSDPYNLDDLDTRRALFEFILDPSAAVIDAHERHLRRWPDAD